MGYIVAFGLVLFGYTLIDWGHYIRRHENVSLWYLISGRGDKYNPGSSTTADQNAKAQADRAKAAVTGTWTATGRSPVANIGNAARKIVGG